MDAGTRGPTVERTRRPTMQDVAAHAGVSLKTVSRVVNDEANVAPTTAARVRAAVDELGYRVDVRARRLRHGDARSGTIGFVLADVGNEFFSRILRGIEEVALAEDALVLAGSTDGDPAREEALVSAFVGRRVDGLVVVPSGDGPHPRHDEVRRFTPVVLLDRERPELVADVVRSDHRAGGELAARHLLAHGHREIAFLGDDVGVFSADERLAGFTDVLAQAGVRLPPGRVLRASGDVEAWRHLGRELLTGPHRPTAVFTAQNLVTLGTVALLHELGLADTVALVGHDDVPMGDVVSPAVSVVPQQPRELGRRAATLLFARIAGDDRPPVRDLVPATLVARGSGELRPR